MVSMEELLNLMVQRGGSDLHISVGSPPRIRIDGKLIDTEYEPLMPEATKKLIYSVLGADQVAKFEKNLELDFSFGVANLGRFRTNAFVQRGTVAAVLRVIPFEVFDFEAIGLPRKVCEWTCNCRAASCCAPVRPVRASRRRSRRWSTTSTSRGRATSSRSRTRSSSCTATRAA